MTKKELRRFFKDILLEKPKGRFQTIARIWDKAIWINAGTIISITAFITNNAGMLLLIIWTLILGLVATYLLAKGR